MHAVPNVILTRLGSLQLVAPLIFLSWLLTAYPWAWFLTDPPEERWSSLFPPGILAATVAQVVLLVATAAALAGSTRLCRLPLPAFGLLLVSIAIPTLAWQRPEIWAPQIIPIDIALAALTLYSTPRVTLTAASLALGLLVTCLITRWVLLGEGGTPSEPGMALTLGTAVLIGTVIRQRRAHAAATLRQASAEAVNAERLRIARDLHDMVAHSLGVIALQAGAARRVMRTQPEAAREAVHNIEKVGQETLSGLRRVVSSLRDVDPDRPDLPTALPSLTTLDELVATTRAAGVDIDVSRQGEPQALPMEIDAAAYRIVQEAVANVIRHAETDACRIMISFREGGLFVEVVDDGTGRGRRPRAGFGFGLTGMRERVEMLNGTIVTGPRPEGGFRVAAHLPIPADAR
ncbi:MULTISPECIES: sensor histidine kinase [Micromonospora]|uniref:histidine kinase n=1 Tax=Micromonospora antibiotica TaxID=2807623 RepID=A0ABS3VFT6_9ACTN|nr:sensor histidine kinase [Micromonospora antibiotica]MBO4164430.1 sensor histidine kinase [Micromonospora antibiotica]